MVRGGDGRVPVRARAGARGADARARAERDPRADGSGAGRRARPRRRRRAPRRGRRHRARRASSSCGRARSSARRRRRRRPERRQPGAGHRRIAAGREDAGRRGVRRHASTAAARSTSASRGCARDTTLARIIHLVERAQAQRAPAQTFVERFARVYTPAVLVLAVAGRRACRRWRSAAPGTTWIYRALVLLVISCPCALVISTPVSIVAALAGAARKGVLIKGGAQLERDRRGALRRLRQDRHADPRQAGGRRRRRAERRRRRAIVALAASVEQRSTHPIAQAIRRARGRSAASRRRRPTRCRRCRARAPKGRSTARRVVLGNHRLFEERRLCSPALHAGSTTMAAAGPDAGAGRARRRRRSASSRSPIGRATAPRTRSTCCARRASSAW